MLMWLLSGLLFGVVNVQLLPHFLSPWALIVLYVTCITLLFLQFFIRVACFSSIIRAGVRVLFGYCLGSTTTMYQISQLSIWQLPQAIIQKKIIIVGRVTKLVHQDSKKVSWFFQLYQYALWQHAHFLLKKIHAHPLLLVTWYHWGPSREAKIPKITIGDVWQLQVRLKPLHGLNNPGLPNTVRWWRTQGIRGSGYVIDSASNKKLRTIKSIFSIYFVRQHIANLILKYVPSHAIAALLVALTVGLRTAMNSSIWATLQATGTSHLMAISGLHLGFLLGFVYFLSEFLWRYLAGRLNLFIPACYAATLMSMMCLLGYACLVGLSLPTQRALIMFFILLLGQLICRYMPLWRRMTLAAIVIVLLEPSAVLMPGFWLSFGAVAAMGYALGNPLSNRDIHFGDTFFYKTLAGCYRYFHQWARVQLVVFIALAPLTLFIFHQLSLVAMLANALAVPWVGMIILPGVLLGVGCSVLSKPAAGWIFQRIGECLQPLWSYLQWLSHWPFAIWHDSLDAWVLFSSLVAVSLYLLPVGILFRLLGVWWTLPLLFPPASPKPLFGNVWLTVLDVGQGLAAVIRTQHHALLYDAGPRYPDGFNAGQSVIVPYLRAQHITAVDTMVISHGDMDHRGGAVAVLKERSVARLLTSVPKKFSHWHPESCYAGQRWRWDGVLFVMLSPIRDQPYLDNDSSCVLQVTDQAGRSILLPGDAGQRVEHRLIAEQGHRLRSMVVIAPHHGSRTASSLAWLKLVSPRYVIFSTGYYNHYYLPSITVVRRYQKIGAKMYNTATDGAVTVATSANKPLTIVTVNKN